MKKVLIIITSLISIIFINIPLFNKDNPKLKLLGTYTDEELLVKAVSVSDSNQVKLTARKVFAKAKCQGDNSKSYSANGQYVVEKMIVPDTHDIQYAKIKIFNEHRELIWSGKTFYHIIIASDGQHFLSLSPVEPGIDLYNIAKPKPIKSFYSDMLTSGTFSIDSQYFILYNPKQISMYNIQSNLLWKAYRSFDSRFIKLSSDGSFIITNSRVYKKDPNELSIDNETITTKKQLKNIAQTDNQILSIIYRNGDIHEVFFDNKIKIEKACINNKNPNKIVIAISDQIICYDIKKSSKIWEYVISNPTNKPVTIFDITYSNTDSLIGIALYNNGVQYHILNTDGELLSSYTLQCKGDIDLRISFSDDNKYLISYFQNNKYHLFQL